MKIRPLFKKMGSIQLQGIWEASWQLPVIGSLGTSLSVGAKVTFYSTVPWPTIEQGSDKRPRLVMHRTKYGSSNGKSLLQSSQLGSQRPRRAYNTVRWAPCPFLPLPFLFPGVTQGWCPGESNLQHFLTTKGLIVKVEIPMKVFIKNDSLYTVSTTFLCWKMNNRYPDIHHLFDEFLSFSFLTWKFQDRHSKNSTLK